MPVDRTEAALHHRHAVDLGGDHLLQRQRNEVTRAQTQQLADSDLALRQFGDQFHFVALAWLVLDLTGSGLALGMVLVAASIPRAILIVVGGALADRIPPRRLILVSDVARGLTVGILTGLILSGRIELWHLVVTGVVFGIIPALQVSGGLQGALKDSGRGSSQSRHLTSVRNGLVVAEVAFACILLVGAGLLIRSFFRVLDVDLGFRPERAA